MKKESRRKPVKSKASVLKAAFLRGNNLFFTYTHIQKLYCGPIENSISHYKMQVTFQEHIIRIAFHGTNYQKSKQQGVNSDLDAWFLTAHFSCTLQNLFILDKWHKTSSWQEVLQVKGHCWNSISTILQEGLKITYKRGQNCQLTRTDISFGNLTTQGGWLSSLYIFQVRAPSETQVNAQNSAMEELISTFGKWNTTFQHQNFQTISWQSWAFQRASRTSAHTHPHPCT